MKYFTSHGKVRDAFATTTTTGPAFKAVSLPKLPQYSPNYWVQCNPSFFMSLFSPVSRSQKPVPATIDDVPNCDRFVFTVRVVSSRCPRWLAHTDNFSLQRYVSDMPCDCTLLFNTRDLSVQARLTPHSTCALQPSCAAVSDQSFAFTTFEERYDSYVFRMSTEKIIAMNLLFQETAWVEKDPVDLKEPWEVRPCPTYITVPSRVPDLSFCTV